MSEIPLTVLIVSAGFFAESYPEEGGFSVPGKYLLQQATNTHFTQDDRARRGRLVILVRTSALIENHVKIKAARSASLNEFTFYHSFSDGLTALAQITYF